MHQHREKGMSGASGTSDSAAGREERPAGRRRRRRWVRRLVVVLAALILLVAAAPYLVSTRPVVGLILGQVNDRIHGRIEIDDLSLGWFTPVEARGVRIHDRMGRQVLRVESLRVPGGLAKRLLAGLAFERLEVDSPKIVLHRTAKGEISLLEALSARRRAPKEREDTQRRDRARQELPKPVGRIVVRNASVLVVRPDGRKYELPDVALEIDLKTLDDIAGRAEVELAEGGRLSADFRLGGLAADGRLDPGRGTGTLSVRTLDRIDLAPISRFALDTAGVEGKGRLDANVSLRDGRLRGSFDVRAISLKASHGGRDEVAPIDLRLKGEVAAAGEEVEASYHLDGEGVRLEGALSYLGAGERPDVSAQQLLAAVLTGEKLTLPGFRLDANGQIDLPRLTRAVPALLGVRQGVAVTGGVVRIDGVAITGGAAPSARGAVTLTALAAQSGPRMIRWRPISVELDAAIVPGEGLRLRDTRVTADFMRLDANGTPARLEATYRADLAALWEQLGEVFNLGELVLAGSATGSVNLSVKDKDKDAAAFRFEAAVRSLAYADGARKLNVAAASLVGDGTVQLRGADGAAAITFACTLEADDELTVKSSGRLQPGRGALQADARLERCVLAGLIGKARGLGVEAPEDLAGGLTGSASLGREAADQPLVSAGALALAGLALQGKPVGKEPIRLDWTNMRIAPKAGHVAVAEAKVLGEPASVIAREVSVRPGEKLVVEGQVTVRADLAACADLAARLGGQKAPAALAGALTWSGLARSHGGEIALSGSGEVKGFSAGAGKEAVRVEPLAFRQAVRIDPNQHMLHVDDLRLDSDVLAVTAAGVVRQYDTQGVLDITGHYKGDWGKLLAVAHQLAPDTRDLSLTGPTESDFRLTGPANQPKLRPVFRGVGGRMAVGWATARFGGFSLGKAQLPMEVSDGQVLVPLTEVPANGGKMRLGGTVDFHSDAPRLRLPGRNVVLEDVEVNREIAREMLSRFNPIFAELVSLDGRVTLATQDLDVPLGEQIKKLGTGNGRLDLTKMNVRPGGLMASLLALGGVGEEKTHRLEAGSVDFVIRDGAIHYDNFTMTFDKTFDLKFQGAVRFDDGLDLAVSVPVRSALLGKLGVRGRAEEIARRLEGARVQMPVLGTRLKPRLDLSRVDIQPLVKKAMEELFTKEVGGLLDELRKPRKEEAPATQPDRRQPPATRPAPKKPEDQVIESIFDLLDGLTKPKKKDKR